MKYQKEKLTISLEGQEVNDFWNIILFVLVYNTALKKTEPKSNTILNESQTKLAEKLEEASRPSCG